jgi:hypothetical protein
MARKKNGTTEQDPDADIADLARLIAGKKEDSGTTQGNREAADGPGESANMDSLDREETEARLRACYARISKTHTFKKGQLVRWKKGLRNKRTPAYGEPIIVVDVLPQGVYADETGSAGSPYFREPLTLVAAEIDRDGDFMLFHYDSRRFEPYTE